jgi:hypothetical protein
MSVDKLTITSLNVDDTSNQLKILFGRDIEEKKVTEVLSGLNSLILIYI